MQIALWGINEIVHIRQQGQLTHRCLTNIETFCYFYYFNGLRFSTPAKRGLIFLRDIFKDFEGFVVLHLKYTLVEIFKQYRSKK
jgi:hypothetical protein